MWFLQQFLMKKFEKNKRKHTYLMWFGRMPTSTGIGKKTFTISKLGLHKRVFILTLRYWNSKNTLKQHSPSGMEQNYDICPFSSICVIHSIWATYYNTSSFYSSSLMFRYRNFIWFVWMHRPHDCWKFFIIPWYW